MCPRGRTGGTRQRRRCARCRHQSRCRARRRSAVQCRPRQRLQRRRDPGNGCVRDGGSHAPGWSGGRHLRAAQSGISGASGDGALAPRADDRRGSAGLLPGSGHRLLRAQLFLHRTTLARVANCARTSRRRSWRQHRGRRRVRSPRQFGGCYFDRRKDGQGAPAGSATARSSAPGRMRTTRPAPYRRPAMGNFSSAMASGSRSPPACATPAKPSTAPRRQSSVNLARAGARAGSSRSIAPVC